MSTDDFRSEARALLSRLLDEAATNEQRDMMLEIYSDCLALGFRGKMAIHPAQISVINEVFAPSPEKIAWARAVAAAFAAAPDKGAVAVDGVMYDRPHLLHAEQLLAQVK